MSDTDYGPPDRAGVPEFVAINGRSYEVIVVAHCVWKGKAKDGVVRHAIKRVLVAARVPPRLRPDLLRQLAAEGERLMQKQRAGEEV